MIAAQFARKNGKHKIVLTVDVIILEVMVLILLKIAQITLVAFQIPITIPLIVLLRSESWIADFIVTHLRFVRSLNGFNFFAL